MLTLSSSSLDRDPYHAEWDAPGSGQAVQCQIAAAAHQQLAGQHLR